MDRANRKLHLKIEFYFELVLWTVTAYVEKGSRIEYSQWIYNCSYSLERDQLPSFQVTISQGQTRRNVLNTRLIFHGT